MTSLIKIEKHNDNVTTTLLTPGLQKSSTKANTSLQKTRPWISFLLPFNYSAPFSHWWRSYRFVPPVTLETTPILMYLGVPSAHQVVQRCKALCTCAAWRCCAIITKCPSPRPTSSYHLLGSIQSSSPATSVTLLQARPPHPPACVYVARISHTTAIRLLLIFHHLLPHLPQLLLLLSQLLLLEQLQCDPSKWSNQPRCSNRLAPL